MGERKLNFDAPLMSVRRIASRPMSPIRDIPSRHSTPTKRSPKLSSEPVTETVAVPFHWEQIPGRAKDTNRRSQPEKPKNISPRFPPGKKAHPSKKFSDHEKDEEEENDSFSDALDTLCSQLSGCSESGASGSNGGGFSTDPHTRDFMMNRFLPAAKAMALEPPRNYVAKKQPSSPHVTRQRVVGEDNKRRPNVPLPPNGVSQRKQQQQECESESEEEEEEDVVESHKSYEPKIMTARGCGLFPRLCFRNTLSLLGPLPGLKIGSPKPSRSAYTQSLSKSVKKAWDNHMKKTESGSFSAHQKVVSEKKKAEESKRFTFSGELIGRLSPFRNSRATDSDSAPTKKKSDVRSRSGELWVPENKGRVVEPKRFAYSGELNRGRLSPFRNTRPAESDFFSKNTKTDIGSRSAELKMVENKRVSDPRRLAYSGDLQRLSSSPMRATRATSISPYRNQTSQSPFRRGAFLGLPNEDNFKTAVNNTRPNRSSQVGNKFQEATGNRASFTSIPAIEKTLYVDTVHNADSSYSYSYSRSGNLGNKPRFLSGEQRRVPRWTEEASEDFSFQDIKSLNNALALEVLEQEIANERKSRHRQKDKSDSGSETHTAKADIDEKDDSLTQSPLHPPLPRSPSESWLWRTIPSVSLRNSFSSKAQAKDLEPKASSMSSTKWETIVKTSKLHNDHARYSEELVAISKQ